MMTPPRPLSEREAEIIEFLVREHLSTATELLEQIPVAWAHRECPFVDIDVPEDAPRAGIRHRGPVEARNRNFDPEHPSWTHVLLWIDDGRLSALELSWVSDDPPKEWPAVDQLEVEVDPNIEPNRRLAAAEKRWVVPWPMLVAVTIGMIVGLLAFAPISCVGDRCQPLFFQWVPFLEGVTASEDMIDGKVGGGLGAIGMFIGGWVGSRVVKAFRR